MVSARPAVEADVPRLAQLCRQVQAELAAQDRGGPLFVTREARPEPVEESLRASVVEPHQTAVVGLIDGTTVGYATGRTEALRDGSVHGIIDDLYVEEEARAVGVGEAMMEVLLEWFRSEGCSGVDSMALPGARATKNFFEESGFSARLLVMHHRMAGG
jgi:GNAT superfamily N-acetyltransferase